MREELKASTDALEHECGKASEDEEILRSLAADVSSETGHVGRRVPGTRRAATSSEGR